MTMTATRRLTCSTRRTLESDDSDTDNDYCMPTTKKQRLTTHLRDYCNPLYGTEGGHAISELRHELYARFYDKSATLPLFRRFDDRLEGDALSINDTTETDRTTIRRLSIPELTKFFDVFDPINTIERHPKLQKQDREVGSAAFEHLATYLLSEEFNELLLQDRKHDATVHAIVSFALPWNRASLLRFGEMHPKCMAFARALLLETSRDNGEYVYRHRESGVPFVRTTFKILRNALTENGVGAAPTTTTSPSLPPFVLINLLPSAFVDFMSNVYVTLRDERFDYGRVRRMLEQPDEIPYNIQDEIGNYRDLKARAELKFITGQACCGKTTLLNAMRRRGWRIVSRGSVGSFAGKSSNPVAVACLHASIDWALRHDNVLGDRGHIDNPLWVGIMQFCDPRHSETLVTDLLNFISDNFNAATLGFFIAQKGVVFVDPYASKCAERMLRRGTGGDAFRGRIATYAIVQTMAYLMVAKLFGWRVYCVPYDASGNFDPSQYGQIAEEMHAFFGEVGTTYPLPRERYGKPLGLLCPDPTYPKSVGIYK